MFNVLVFGFKKHFRKKGGTEGKGGKRNLHMYSCLIISLHTRIKYICKTSKMFQYMNIKYKSIKIERLEIPVFNNIV